MHHLHPRSRSTSTLFTTTLAISFLVVGAPHLLPCPVDKRQFADSFETQDGKRYTRKRKSVVAPSNADEELGGEGNMAMTNNEKPKRECPVPKPGGIVGQLMGFKNQERTQPTEIVIKDLDLEKARKVRNYDNEGP